MKYFSGLSANGKWLMVKDLFARSIFARMFVFLST